MKKSILKYTAIFGLGAFVGYAIHKIFNTKDRTEKKEISEEEEEDFDDQTNNFDRSKIDLSKEQCAIFIIRKDLKMQKGKIVAQCGHASLGIFLKVLKEFPQLAEVWFNENSFPKKFYYCNSENEMDEKRELAKSMGLLSCKIHDAGRTQIAAGSATVLSIGPVTQDMVKNLTKGLTPIN
ncbi:peptidyl-trna hydrolase [Histomonas meleagridis]|uniref:peptidyl-trna hydrolase n=1 Tax=Histomonas meleagridis TaxID=135588 RepID=UPI003559C85C|nr:peptidyl-trna hydrolase [Histomonas meleagridis]KAH0803074.1 peptidyl-trna hydrolase [Histomonas meleagridis]